ncbi:MAG: ABC transporter ATP-binding protein/permease [Defluviitaleaceae bacterium]|nr:ABC transporter ATP-binding protein/permease [Defluviitaleaceae bacterium]
MNIAKIILKNITVKGAVGIIFNSMQAVFHSLFIGLSLMYIFDNESENLLHFIIILFGMIIYFIYLIPLFGYMMEINQYKFMKNLGTLVFKNIINSNKWIDSEYHSSKEINILKTDVAEASSLIGWSTIVLFQAIISGIVSMVVIGTRSITILIILILLGIFFLFANMFFSKQISKYSKERRNIDDSRIKNIVEILNNFTLLKIFGTISQNINHSKKINEDIFKKDNKLNRTQNISKLVSDICFNGGFNIAVIIIGAINLTYGNITFGVFLLIFQMIDGLIFLFSSIVGYIANFQKTIISIKNVNMKIKEIDDLSNESLKKLEYVKNISFDNVYFYYNSDKPILIDKTFELTFPNDIWIKGVNGSGKSTLFKLLNQIIEPQKGTIKINGYDIKTYTKQSVSRKIGYVPQIPLFFEDSILGNLSLERVDISNNELLELMKLLKLDRIVTHIEKNGYFLVEERGNNLSSGEKIRLAIARALVTSPNIILLDEIEANLDTNTLNSIITRIKEKYDVDFIRISHQDKEPIPQNNLITLP